MEEWTRSVISERLHREMCQYDDNQEPFGEQKKYYIDALQYASRRAIVKKPSDFQDVFHVYILTFSDELRDHIQRIVPYEDAINEVISNAVKRIIKARNPEIYRDYLQFEPLRWDLINGDGNGKGDGSLIAEHVTIADTASEESVTITQRLAKQIMRQYTFATTTKDEQLFYYDTGKGIYCPDIEWLIKQQCRILHSKIKSYEIEEVIKFIKDSTYIDRSLFDSNPDLINLQNGVLNIHTGEFKEHSPDLYFLSVIPYLYEPKAQCPTIVKFLHDAQKSTNDYITVIELFGYCLYKTAKYEKAVLCVGDGDNGKGTLLKLFERFVGLENACHVSLQDINN